MSSLINKVMSSTLLGASLAVTSLGVQASGLPVTLPTAAINANSTFTFSEDSSGMMDQLGVSVAGLGNAKMVAGSNGMSFDMPVTKVSVLANLFPPNLTPVSGEAMGSGLGFSRAGASGFALANFGLDFKRNVLQADFITNGTTVKAMDIFNFKVDQDLTISMNGGLSLNMGMDEMFLTSLAQERFATALKLPSYATAVLGGLDFGSLYVDIDPSLRFGLSDKALVASAVPEAPQAAMLLLGLVGLAAVSNRKRG